MVDKRLHWDHIYSTRRPDEVSWTQQVPTASLQFVHAFKLPHSAGIIDIGGGDSKLVDYLLDEGYEDLTVLDISEKAILKAQARLGGKAGKVQWVVSDIMEFKPRRTYDFWHDRATFHFLTKQEEIEKYLNVTRQAVRDNGYIAIGTFSENGPEKCSGLAVKQYSEQSLMEQLKKGFEKIRCFTENHVTPFSTVQNFLFCSFQRHFSV